MRKSEIEELQKKIQNKLVNLVLAYTEAMKLLKDKMLKKHS